ncbi:zinc finger protein 503-like [Actinia tenebrosa]|uniref:Zinc finger protein 503-like n=1 Tax=Actinia tenebrosa TaxID=6105 RepID=A0A6P8HKL2_ACTTE|nr:zinc finger protein 503-like [Actinia tenebrosa]
MPTKTFGLRPVEHSENLSQGNRVPLEALQMLTQSVSKCNQDYIQPLPLKDDEQKKSPLALLAATCSSIGKAEPAKTAEPERDNTSLSTKISSDETRSSFKPYKQTGEKGEEMTEKASFRTPSKENTSRASPTDTKDEPSKLTGFPYSVSEGEGHCGFVHSQASRGCGLVVESGQAGQNLQSLHKECGGNCSHPSTLIPFKGSLPYPPALVGLEQSALKSHGIPTSLGSIAPIYPQCACVFCSPHGESAAAAAAQGIPLPQASSRPLQLHTPATPYVDYLQRTICRDANCTNCRAQVSPYGLASPVQQCGPHCVQCENIKTPEQSSTPYSCFYPHNLAMFKSTQDEAHPYVCNWVSGAKHCGKSFSTSEDLFQHLRSHTQLGNSVSPPVPQPAPSCNVHGCPCKLQGSQASLHASRYRPYYYKPSVIPSPPTAPISCYSTSPYGPIHSLAYDPHRLFK